MSSLTAIIILLCIVIALVVLLFIAIILLLRRNSNVQKLTYPVYEYVVKKAEHESDAMLKKARSDADALIAHAEKEGQSIVGSYTKKAEEAHRDFAGSFSQLEASLEGMLAETKDAGGAELRDLFARAKEALAHHEETWDKQAEEITGTLHHTAVSLQKQGQESLGMIDEHLKRVQSELEAALRTRMESQDKAVAEHLEEVTRVAEAEIGAYKKARIAILDTHIEKLVQDVVKEVLHTQLSFKEHGALARAALIEAKEHNLL